MFSCLALDLDNTATGLIRIWNTFNQLSASVNGFGA
jgi:hypothetical protein